MNSESFIDLANKRYSCRNYSDKPVPAEAIENILTAARLAPSACNRQPWKFIVAVSEEAKAKICKAYHRDFIRQAPVLIVVCGIHGEAWHRAADGKDHTDVDAAIAGEHICLAAASAGLGSCWICNFEPEALRALDLPEGTEPIAIIPIGYPAEGMSAPEKKRKNRDETVVMI